MTFLVEVTNMCEKLQEEEKKNDTKPFISAEHKSEEHTWLDECKRMFEMPVRQKHSWDLSLEIKLYSFI